MSSYMDTCSIPGCKCGGRLPALQSKNQARFGGFAITATEIRESELIANPPGYYVGDDPFVDIQSKAELIQELMKAAPAVDIERVLKNLGLSPKLKHNKCTGLCCNPKPAAAESFNPIANAIFQSRKEHRSAPGLID